MVKNINLFKQGTKRGKTVFLFLSLLFISGALTVKAENDKFEWLSNFNDTVSAGNSSYVQTFMVDDEKECLLSFTIMKISKKGKTDKDVYYFPLSELDENTVSFNISGKMVTVTVNTVKKQKFILNYKNDKFMGYKNTFMFYAKNVDQAKMIVGDFKKQIPVCRSTIEKWSSIDEALNFIKNNVKGVSLNGKTMEQSFSVNEKTPWLGELTQASPEAKANSLNSYIFNFSDINPVGIVLKVSGKTLSVELPVRGNAKYIKYKKDSIQQNYISKVSVPVSDPEHARKLIHAFEYVVDKTQKKQPEWQNVDEAVNYVKSGLKVLNMGSYTYWQEFSYNANDGKGVVTSFNKNSKDYVQKEEYIFYFSDINAGNVDAKINGKTVNVVLPVTDGKKFVKTIKNRQLQNYGSRVKIVLEDLDSARNYVNAIRYIVSNSPDGIIPWRDKEAAIQWIQENTGTVSIDGTEISQKIKIDNSEPYKVVLDVLTTTEKDKKDETFEFYIHDISSGSVSMNIVGKRISIKLNSGKKKLIRYTLNGDQKNYLSGISVLTDDVRKAKNMVEALNFLVSEVTFKPLEFENKKQAIDWIMNNVKGFRLGDVSLDQSVQLLTGDGCKMKYNYKTTDAKGNVNEYIYEFSLSDLNSSKISFEVTGTRIAVKLSTVNDQKLISFYKNSKQMNYLSRVELLVNDILTARYLTEAVKSAVKFCE